MAAIYDTIGKGYAGRRQPDPRIAAQMHKALGAAKTVLNVGAGTGSYEPSDRMVTALEPSLEMIQQRPLEAAPAYQGRAENLPFKDKSFDAAMAVLTVHHWSDVEAGLAELARVARSKIVVLTFDPTGPYFWLADYIPEIVELDQPVMPAMSTYAALPGKVSVEPVLVPHDCLDGFLGAYWRRPEIYLDPAARSAISTFALIGEAIAPNLKKLEEDLSSGVWQERYGHLMNEELLDIGYRLVIADLS